MARLHSDAGPVLSSVSIPILGAMVAVSIMEGWRHPDLDKTRITYMYYYVI